MPTIMAARSSKPRLGHGAKLKVPVQMLVEGTTDEPLQHGLIGAYRVVVTTATSPTVAGSAVGAATRDNTSARTPWAVSHDR
jgi:hypothetical protein